MENASKALIIAGAILLAILIIGLGVFIFGQVANSVGNTGMEQLTVQQFNSQFENYEGTQTGSQVKQLLKVVRSNNYTYSDDESMKVTVNKDQGKVPNIGSGKMYTVTLERNPNNGLVQNIQIAEKTN